MFTFVMRNLLNGVTLIFVVTGATFLLIHMSGGNIARNILGDDATIEEVKAKAAELGLDRPLLTQYWNWLSGVLSGDWGNSYFSSQSVASAMNTRLPVTLSLIFLSIAITAVVSVILGTWAASRGGAVDRLVQFLSVAGFALPNYWIALVLVLLVALPLQGIFAATGYVPLSESFTGWLSTITLPALAVSIGGVSSVAQQVRGSMLDTLRRDFIRTLRSRGVSRNAILYRHALRNAASPAMTVLSLQFIAMLGGAVIIEQIFALPGLGSLVTTASLQGDIPIVMGVVTYMVAVIVIVNLVIDFANGWLNPKARIE
ncbi:ABC transporter permease [Arthrobacter castelli]|uniref:ABC transporter permease n=1 Tax=Arthrobacter castelli TaxID=271431 RepID=UPI000409448A|nr:ABC transporter permease [Arthrobacter castelli]